MRRQYLVQFRVFLQVVLDGIPLSSCTVYRSRYLCGIFLDDISTRDQFAFLVYCYRVKQFSTIYALCFTGVCGCVAIVKYPLNWGWCALSAGFLKQWLPNGKLLLLSLTKCHGVPCSLPSRITTKVLKTCKTFSSRPRPRPRPNVQDQDQNFMIQDQDQDQDFHFCPRGASRPRPWSRGLHHCSCPLANQRALTSRRHNQLASNAVVCWRCVCL